jgi:hypothetical protein
MKDNMLATCLIITVTVCFSILGHETGHYFRGIEADISDLQDRLSKHEQAHVREGTTREALLKMLRYNDCYVCHDQQDGCYRDDNDDVWCSEQRR